jgi:hypothetical protein
VGLKIVLFIPEGVIWVLACSIESLFRLESISKVRTSEQVNFYNEKRLITNPLLILVRCPCYATKPQGMRKYKIRKGKRDNCYF